MTELVREWLDAVGCILMWALMVFVICSPVLMVMASIMYFWGGSH